MYAEKFRLDGKVAVVTGGGRGIGLSCVEALAEHGAKVVIADIDKAIADEGAAAMKAKGFEVAIYQVDVTKSAEVDGLADWVVSTFGKADILVANAGIARSGVAAEEVTDEHWLHVNDVNTMVYSGATAHSHGICSMLIRARSSTLGQCRV